MGQPRGHLAGLTGLRGIAALMVFAYHARWRAGDPELPLGLHEFLRSFDSGVAIFFVLSGFLLSLPFWEHLLENRPAVDPKAYVLRRLARIVPAYYAVIFILYLLHYGTYSLYGGLDFLLHCFFLQNLTDYTYSSQLNPTLWSIGIEFWFYLFLPGLMAAIAGASRRNNLTLACSIGLTLILGLSYFASPIFTPFKGMFPARFIEPENHSAVLSTSLFFYLRYFAAGIFLAPLFIHLRKSLPSTTNRYGDLACIIALAAFSTILLNTGEGDWKRTGLLNYPTNALCIALLVLTLPLSTIGNRWLETRPLQFLGEISYGIYLWHWPIQIAVFGGTLPDRLEAPATLLVCGLVSLVLSILLASLSYWLIEKPAIQWARQRHLPPRPPLTPSQQTVPI